MEPIRTNSYDENKVVAWIADPERMKEAFSMIVAHYQQTLYHTIRRIVLVHEDANDVLQNVFLKAWSNLHYFRGEAKMSTWLYRIAVNESLNHLHKTQERLSLNEVDQDLLGRMVADAYFDGDEWEVKFQEAVLSLPEKQRIIFQLKYFEEMKYEDISDILGTTVGGLKSSYHHAVKKITEFLQLTD